MCNAGKCNLYPQSIKAKLRKLSDKWGGKKLGNAHVYAVDGQSHLPCSLVWYPASVNNETELNPASVSLSV